MIVPKYCKKTLLYIFAYHHIIVPLNVILIIISFAKPVLRRTRCAASETIIIMISVWYVWIHKLVDCVIAALKYMTFNNDNYTA